MAETALRGSRPRQLPRANRIYAEGRVCVHEGCVTKISMYNKSPYCWAHAPLKFPLTRGARRRKAAA